MKLLFFKRLLVIIKADLNLAKSEAKGQVWLAKLKNIKELGDVYARV